MMMANVKKYLLEYAESLGPMYGALDQIRYQKLS
jgi:hypothetical protein